MRILPLLLLTLLLLASLYPEIASSQVWCDEPICAQFEGSDTIRILAPGRFEITFTKPVGFGELVYDLQADPDKLYDLSGLGTSTGILWTKVSEVGDPLSYFANHATDLELLESGGVRVRARHSGSHHGYGNPGNPWNDLGYVQTFTVYATGEVYVDYSLVASRDITLRLFTLVLKSTGDWGNNPGATAPGEAYCVGEHGLSAPYTGTLSPFAMVSSNGSRYYADMFMALYEGIYYGSYWNGGFNAVDYRCALRIPILFPDLIVPTGTSHIPILMRIAQDMNDPASATKYSDDFRNPDAAFAVLQGVKVLTDPGDRDGDGFNEDDGTYVVSRQGSQDVEFILHGDRPRMNPAFKILDWDEPSPQSIWVDDVLWLEGAQFRASTIGADLILQLLGERTQDTRILVQSGAAQVPSLTWPAGLMLIAGLVASGVRRVSRSS